MKSSIFSESNGHEELEFESDKNKSKEDRSANTVQPKKMTAGLIKKDTLRFMNKSAGNTNKSKVVPLS